MKSQFSHPFDSEQLNYFNKKSELFFVFSFIGGKLCQILRTCTDEAFAFLEWYDIVHHTKKLKRGKKSKIYFCGRRVERREGSVVMTEDVSVMEDNIQSLPQDLRTSIVLHCHTVGLSSTGTWKSQP